MLAEVFQDVPQRVKIIVAAAACLLVLLFLRGHLYYFRDPFYLGGLVVVEIVLASLWHFEVVFFPLLMCSFLWAGMNVPFSGVATTARWFVLAVAALAGFAIWMRERRHTYSSFHLVALFCVVAGLVSSIQSADPTTALLKVLSLFLLFLYGATGARLTLLGREAAFVRGLLLGCEIIVYFTATAYFGTGMAIFGNANSLGAVMGVAIIPLLLWGYMIAETRSDRYRRLGALGLAGVLLYLSVCRAGMLAAAVSVLTLCIALRRQRLLIQGAFFTLLVLAFAAMLNPAHFDDFVGAVTSNIVYKGKNEQGLLASRKTPWEETVAVVREHPWFGSGFGTSDMGEWARRSDLSLSPAAGGLYTREGTNREHGNSYLALAEYMGLLGLLPFVALLFLAARMIGRVCLWMRHTADPYNCAVPLAMVLLAGMVHAVFEDWLVAAGYYLCVFFWITAFWLADLMPASMPAAVWAPSAADPRVVHPYAGALVPNR
jgi:O-antigen ligase